jgi:hypothetical protein
MRWLTPLRQYAPRNRGRGSRHAAPYDQSEAAGVALRGPRREAAGRPRLRSIINPPAGVLA